MRCILVTGLGTLIALIGGPYPAAASEPKHATEQFLADCKAGLDKLEQRARLCNGRYKMIEGGAILDLQRVRDIEFAVSGDQVLLKTHDTLEKRRGNPDKVYDHRAVRAANPEYSFHISMRNETGEYRLVHHELAADVASKSFGSTIRDRVEFWMDPVRGTHWIGQYPLGPLLKHPTFRVLKLTDQTRDGVRVIRAEFDSNPGGPNTDPRMGWSRGKVFGWFEVAPTEGWTVRAFEYTHFVPGARPEVPAAKSREVGEVGYAPGPNGLPVVARYKRSTAWLEMPLDSYFQMEDVQIGFGPTPAEQFRLTHYGLPEPVGVAPLSKAGVPVHWWFLAAAGGFALATVAFRWLARRGSASSTPPSST